jgi:hypothetical protein
MTLFEKDNEALSMPMSPGQGHIPIRRRTWLHWQVSADTDNLPYPPFDGLGSLPDLFDQPIRTTPFLNDARNTQIGISTECMNLD